MLTKLAATTAITAAAFGMLSAQTAAATGADGAGCSIELVKVTTSEKVYCLQAGEYGEGTIRGEVKDVLAGKLSFSATTTKGGKLSVPKGSRVFAEPGVVIKNATVKG